jgi:hypothetical protein
MASFIFDATKGETPAQLAKMRAIVDALRPQGGAPKTIGDGIAMLGQALSARMGYNAIEKEEAAGKASAQPFSNSIGAALQGPSAYPSVPSGSPSTPPGEAFGGDLKSGISATAQALGIDPVDLATAISYETGGTFDPTKKGPTTQWGQHQGLIQFGEPQAKKYGVDWSNPVGSQLGPDGAVAKYLRDTGVKPGMGMMDIYSAINAGGVGRYNASDANNGGAPGTVADKVNKQMAGHRAKALAMMGGNQVASNDPQAAIMMALAGPQEQPAQQQPVESIPDPFTPSIQGQDVTPQPQQVAQDLSQIPPMAGGAGDTDPNGGPSMDLLFKALGNDFLPEDQRAIVQSLIGQRLKQNDPNNQLDAEYKRAQIEALRAKNSGQGGTEYGLNPQYGVDENGNPVIVQLGKDGTSTKTPLPAGVQLSKEPIRLDAWTHFVLLDPITRQPIGQIPKELAEAERQKALGDAAGKADAGAAGDLQSAQNSLDLIEGLRNDPNRERGTGFSSIGNIIPGTAGYDFANKVEQAKSGAFLTAIQQMRGMGALSNAEGSTATAAVNRMNTSTSEEEFMAALADYEKVVRQGMERAQGRVERGAPGLPAQMPTTTQPKRLKFNPATGELE